jgi:hypothetical protein
VEAVVASLALIEGHHQNRIEMKIVAELGSLAEIELVECHQNRIEMKIVAELGSLASLAIVAIVLDLNHSTDENNLFHDQLQISLDSWTRVGRQ